MVQSPSDSPAVPSIAPAPDGGRRRGRLFHFHGFFAFTAFLVGLALAYGYGMSSSNAAPAVLWAPDSVLLCALLFSPPRRWWIYLLAALPVRFYVGLQSAIPMWLILATLPNDYLKAMLAAWLLRRMVPGRFALDSLVQLRAFFCVAVVLSPALSAFAGAGVRCIAGQPFWTNWYQWFLGDALAALVLTPTLICWIVWIGERRGQGGLSRGRYAESLLVSCGLLLASYAAFGRTMGHAGATAILYAPIAFLIWLAARFGPMGVSTGVSIVGMLAMLGSGSGRGPFVADAPSNDVLGMQLFLLVISLPLLLLSVLMTERRKNQESLQSAMADLAAGEERLRENYEHIRKLSTRLLTAHEDERKAISRELHDDVCQDLTGVLLTLALLKRQSGVPEPVIEQVDSVVPLISAMATKVRNLSRQLHPTVVESMGLAQALELLCAQSRSLYGMEVELSSAGLPAEASPDSALCLYYIAQEALRNAARHSGSERARIEVVTDQSHIQLRVKDWGCGFDLSAARRKGGLGLVSMEERARSLQGRLQISSLAGDGTEVSAEVPLRPAPAA
jgi:signal transduction histidine kinase